MLPSAEVVTHWYRETYGVEPGTEDEAFEAFVASHLLAEQHGS